MKGKFFLALLILSIVIIIIVNRIVEAPIENIAKYNSRLESNTVKLAFVGDVMLGRNVEVLMDKFGYSHPFASTTEIFKKADFIVANLEGPVPLRHIHTNSGEMSFSFPAYIPKTLFENGIDAVSLANNHTYDKGSNVFMETVESLKNELVSSFGHPVKQNISHVGHYEVKGISFSLIGFNATFPSFKIEEVSNVIIETRLMYPNNRIIVFMHWGDEYQLISNTNQKEISKKLHDAGADLIIGAHPHVTQEISCEGIGRCTIYSLGNFIFDQYFSKDVEQGVVAYVTLDKNAIKDIELVPIEGNHSQPKIMSNTTEFISDLLKRSYFKDVEVSTSSQSIILR